MTSLYDFHLKNNAKMGIYNNANVPSAYHDPMVEYKAVRENALLVDYSHMSIVSVMGDDAWALVNYYVSADVSIIRDEQGIYSLVLNEDGTVRGDVYVLCASDGYYIMSENIPAAEIIAGLNALLVKADELDIQETPDIADMREQNWGAIMVEGPYSWELMSEIHGFDVIGLPYYEYMNTDDELMVFRCGKHGEFAYMVVGQQEQLLEQWQQLLEQGDKYQLKTGGLDYQKIVRIENPGWDEALWAGYRLNPVELQMQWAVQYDKEGFVGKEAAEALSHSEGSRKVIGMIVEGECAGIASGDSVLVDGQEVGKVAKAIFSPALQCVIALALIENEFAWSDISGFDIQTASENVAAKTKGMPFIYNLSMLVNPTENSFVDASKAKSAL
ncbi:aminomethyltransferase family protein [Enterobacter hormaechei]|uniref:aminomethyltransferase family protein n=1 Tax=Enterobacter cloacae complex TaxID=354276 RepID=UPI0003BE23CC|nr:MULTISPECIES: aminomethyltransferase family protein [Enterobacter cloacae complex]PJI14774.1 aminomethyltransferase [Enterobacter cloacae complex sp.]EHN8840258.1 aminomethyltransferase family protein [Enterobacter hormaechei]EHN8865413.1 aminomethyltransferase family protein [Enterobacter hormaechei]EKS6543947.1 aminomethyltransferase family protein [Enterobacter hormaechei]ESM44056.1 aminomethyltransferase [Enterobacter hormaechei]